MGPAYLAHAPGSGRLRREARDRARALKTRCCERGPNSPARAAHVIRTGEIPAVALASRDARSARRSVERPRQRMGID
jgi:hypothetical protein